jgi:hypothetical protein
MGRKPKAGGAKGKTTDPEQSARFIEAARRVGVDETGEVFERAFEKVARARRATPEAGSAERPTPRRKPQG